MKQIAKTQQVKDRMRAAFGADAEVDTLPVYEAVTLNTLPLRKASGLFKNARTSPATLSEVAYTINRESAPLQSMHNTDALPGGRVFYAEVVGDEVRSLFTVTNSALQSDIDKGTIDQVSVGYMPRSINCSSCGFDYLGADANIDNLLSLTCNDGHVLGEDGVHANLDGVASFYELSLVGKGAVHGAKIVGPSDSRLAGNDNFQRLAASAKSGFAGVQLTATIKENPSMDAAALLAQIQTNATENVDLRVKLTASEAVAAQVPALQASNTELKLAADKVPALEAQLAEQTLIVDHFRTEAKKILTACQKPTDGVDAMTVTELAATIEEHRAQFAAAIPIGGRLKATQTASEAAPRSNSAFRAPR